jgi:hypothetical protein
MALVGYEMQKQNLEAKIREVRAALRLDGATSQPAPEPKKRKKMSASARRRIAAAQKKRWAEHRKKMAAK